MAPERERERESKEFSGLRWKEKTDEDNNKKNIYGQRETEGEGEKERE